MKKLSIRRIWIVALAFAIPLFLLQCKRASEKSAEKTAESIIETATGQKADVDQDGEKLTVKTEEGEVRYDASEKTWPADMPAEVPKINGLKITATAKSESLESESWTVYLEGANAGILDAYDAELKKAGFKTAIFKLDDSGSVSGEKGKLTVSCISGEGNTILSVVKRKN